MARAKRIKIPLGLILSWSAIVLLASSCQAKTSSGTTQAPVPGGSAPAQSSKNVAISKEHLDSTIRSLGFLPLEKPVPLTEVDAKLSGLDGSTPNLSSFGSKLLLINFWATWCPPCRAEMPSLDWLEAKLGPTGLKILAIDSQEPPSTIKEFLKTKQFRPAVFLDEDGYLSATFGVRNLPSTFLATPDGNIVAAAIGSRDWSDPKTVESLRSLLPR